MVSSFNFSRLVKCLLFDSVAGENKAETPLSDRAFKIIVKQDNRFLSPKHEKGLENLREFSSMKKDKISKPKPIEHR
jgi:hypothetical protein